MSGRVVGWAFDRGADLSASELLVLVALADNADRHGKCWPSKPEVVDKTRLSRATVYRALGRLEDLGYFREGTDEEGRECFWLAVDGASHGEMASRGETSSSRGETEASHGENRSDIGTVIEPSEEPSLFSSATESIFEFWRSTFELNGNTKLTPGRRRAIRGRLRDGYTEERIRRAILGCAGSEFHRSGGHTDLTLICRNGEKLERFETMPPPTNHRGEGVLRRERDGVPELSLDGGETWETDYEVAIQRRRERANG